MARRRYHGAVEVNLGDYASLDRTVGTKDVLIGLALGVAGAAAAAFGRKKLAESGNTLAANPYLVMAIPAVGGAAAGFAAWMARKNKSRQAAFANLLGAAGAGVALAVWPKVATMVGFAGYDGSVGIDIPYGGMLVDDSAGESNQGLSGLLVDDAPAAMRGYADRSGMGRLAAASLDPDEDYSEMGRLAAFASYRELDVEGQG